MARRRRASRFWQIGAVIVGILLIAALHVKALLASKWMADENIANLRGAQLAFMRLLYEGDGQIPAWMDLQDVLDNSGLELINPYARRPVMYLPFGSEPSPGDLTGYITDCVAIHTMGPSYPTDADVVPNSCYYLFVYGAPGDPGLDVTWDGQGDAIAAHLQTAPIFGVVAGGECRLKPLDLVFDEHGIEHGPAPDTPGQCAWGKPCVETAEWCPICYGIANHGASESPGT